MVTTINIWLFDGIGKTRVGGGTTLTKTVKHHVGASIRFLFSTPN
jgi:hypothetical protein